MISVQEALDKVLATVGPLEAEDASLAQAAGRVLAEPVRADRDYPPCDRAMMDGYALRASDAPAGPVELRVAGEVAAGETWSGAVEPGCAVRIMTGAPVPAGLDAVIRVEDTEPCGEDLVRLAVGAEPGGHVDRRGGHLRAGDEALAAGTVLGPAALAVAATVGALRLRVHRMPVTALLGTGNELVEVSATPGPGQVRDSNTIMLEALLAREGMPAQALGRVPDRRDATVEAIRRGLEADVLVLTGGVSMGDYDFVGRALADEGAEVRFHRVRLKPGRPTLFALCRGKPVFGLPGNPVSALVTATLFVLPALRCMAGRARDLAVPVRLPGRVAPDTRWRRRPVEGFLPAVRVRRGAAVDLAPADWKGSGDVFGAARADSLAVVPAGEGWVEAGEPLDWIALA